MGRLELPRVTPLEPKSSAYTSSATFAAYPAGQDTPLGRPAPSNRTYHNRNLNGIMASLRQKGPGSIYRAGNDGGPCRSRTYDLLIKSQLLYQLS